MSSLAQHASLAAPSLSAGPSYTSTHADSTGDGNFSRTTSASEPPASASSVPTSQELQVKEEAAPPRPLVSVNVEGLVQEVKRRGAQKGRNAEEVEAMARTAARIAERIAADQTMALQPDTETPFVDAEDVVRRLLPYHIFQHPKEDLYTLTGRKGKRKATEEDLLREEIAETKFAIDCWKRKTTLERKFRRIRTNAGKRKAPDDQAYVLAQTVLEADRAELAALNAEYRTARAELDRVERERKASAAAAAPPPPAPAPKPTPAKPAATRLPYYPPSASSSTATTSIFPQTPTSYTAQYKNYAYPYSQAYSSAYTAYTPPAFSSTSATRKAPPMSRTPSNVPVLQLAPPSVQVPSATPRPPTATSPAGSSPATASPAQTTGSATVGSTSAPNVAPIPVHLPVSALTSLSALGIVPVPAANAPPSGEPQPACVLKGTSQNGTMVSLDMNVSALGQAQASGLAVLLSALTTRNGAGSAPAASATSPGAVGGTDGGSSAQSPAGGGAGAG
ncbi:hypothetical protein PHLGIDRAFT_127050 [Phlebiopsis gigantea 11061_1 CR5-6]|uniref:GLTSCR protein conserved domain-containing protein n=1 Tax=Phlebiopsis gigantea (strain 11061_1 CR5-6) TaxID=745531 RepID=A0A0C3S9M3_PHLG1|nr:hypothetical protein PHLGIDRAFT_127050 [Phlebiopsis gigantea 11061_1 CR5-6]